LKESAHVADQSQARKVRARLLRALGDPVRLGVVDLLVAQDLSPDALAASLEVPGNLLAHHLKVLERAGLIVRTTSQHDRRRTYVRLVTPALAGLLPSQEPLAAPRVVFVCTRNSARSVMAEAAWRAVSDVPCASAGTRPAPRIHPRARTAVRKAGLALGCDRPRSITDVLAPDDLVVSVCDAVNEEIGALPNVRLHWSIGDPARADSDAAFARALAELRRRTAQLASGVRRGADGFPAGQPEVAQ
jgi:ArsR family transcriptional regulator, arsenate/arsenite/antimonite-responsive transcriptional repressor / arsenate reductase (thioredoxin)